VGGYLDRWLDAIRGTVRVRSWKRSEEIVRIHLVPSLGKTRLNRLSALQLQSLYSSKLDSGLSARTVRMIHTVLHKALKQAVKWSLISRNITEAVNPPREQKKEIRPLKEEEVKRLLKVVQGDKLDALYILAITTGMRLGELLGLRYEDIDLQAGTLQVKRTVFNGQIEAPKTLKGKRSIKLTQTSIRALQKHQKVSEWVFSTKVGTPISVHNLHNRSWKPLLNKTGLPLDTRFHDLRHTCATGLTPLSVPGAMRA
jgi:integrase